MIIDGNVMFLINVCALIDLLLILSRNDIEDGVSGDDGILTDVFFMGNNVVGPKVIIFCVVGNIVVLLRNIDLSILTLSLKEEEIEGLKYIEGRVLVLGAEVINLISIIFLAVQIPVTVILLVHFSLTIFPFASKIGKLQVLEHTFSDRLSNIFL